MFHALRAVVWGAGIFAVAVAAGCESSNGGSAASGRGAVATQPGQAVACGKCQVTWVREPVTTGGGKPRIVSYSARKSMQCPDCRSAVDNFFRSGRLEHTCKTCGDSLEVCEAH